MAEEEEEEEKEKFGASKKIVDRENDYKKDGFDANCRRKEKKKTRREKKRVQSCRNKC